MRNIHRLTPSAVKNAKPGKRPDGTFRAKIYPDGGGLYLKSLRERVAFLGAGYFGTRTLGKENATWVWVRSTR